MVRNLQSNPEEVIALRSRQVTRPMGNFPRPRGRLVGRQPSPTQHPEDPTPLPDPDNQPSPPVTRASARLANRRGITMPRGRRPSQVDRQESPERHASAHHGRRTRIYDAPVAIQAPTAPDDVQLPTTQGRSNAGPRGRRQSSQPSIDESVAPTSQRRGSGARGVRSTPERARNPQRRALRPRGRRPSPREPSAETPDASADEAQDRQRRGATQPRGKRPMSRNTPTPVDTLIAVAVGQLAAQQEQDQAPTRLNWASLSESPAQHQPTPPMEQAEESDLASAQPTLAPRAVYQRRQRNYVSMSGRQPFRRAAPPGSEDESSDSSESSSSEEDEDEFGRLLRRVQMRLPKIDRSAHVAVPLVTVPEQPQPSAAPCAQPQNVAIQHPVTNQLATQARPSGIPRLQTADPPSTTGHSADLQKFLDSGVYKRLLNKVRDQKWRALQKYNRLRQHSVRNKIYMGCDQIRKGDAMEKIKAEHAVVELTRSIQKLEFDKNELHSARANVFEMEDAARRDDPTTYATAMEYVWATDTKTRTSSETQTVD
ncbi:hypothetical protein QR680_003144 [Steinernema hermaphroditum]|uniref:Uncharacterized protein n=1 Tax=Steinernema hermaphroditum TaxID=289476 RepID=A0AA39H5J4_9BILA|nr:hypothetical protein QR680_003144 [Steinernema hermaphroditum]